MLYRKKRIIIREHYIPPGYHSLMKIKRKASLLNKGVKNYTTDNLRKLPQNLYQMLFWHLLRQSWVSFFQSPPLPELYLAVHIRPNLRTISYTTSPKNGFKKLKISRNTHFANKNNKTSKRFRPTFPRQ